MSASLLAHSGADIVGEYRYRLWRGDPSAPACVFVMLNPSTADADHDDPTIRRCRDFAYGFGYDRLVVVNLYALRATDPKALWRHPDPVGPRNNAAIADQVSRAGMAVAAWGVHARPARVRSVLPILRSAPHGLRALGLTKAGHPKHPLYLRKDCKPIPYQTEAPR